MSVFKQINVGQEILKPTLGSHLRGVENGAPTSIFKRAVVIDVLCDISKVDAQETERLTGETFEVGAASAPRGTSDKVSSGAGASDKKKSSISYKDFLGNAPRNSIIARIVSMGEDNTSTGNVICYPFFPPHICFPIKAGEQVWVMFESPDLSNKIGYWVCRISEPDFVDDVNYTHADRKFQDIAPKKSSDKVTGSSSVGIPGFFNGDPDGKNGETLRTKNDKENPFEEIYNDSLSNKSFAMEPVPRYTKRPGDLILQGSNNTLVSLGQDRGWSKSERPSKESNASSASAPSLAGTIDIVAGRGRFPGNSITADADTADTMPKVTVNTKGLYEVNKNPVGLGVQGIKDNKSANPVEGDPDFVHDASRIYVSMNTSGDKSFSTQDSMSSYMKEDFGILDVDDMPYIIAKSNEIRIISRHTPGDDLRLEEKGSIRIIREDGDGKKVCSIVMSSNGEILIDAEKIVVGDGRNDQIYLGNRATESAVLGDKLVQLLTNFCNEAQVSVGSFGDPIKGLPEACINLRSQLSSIKSSVTKVK